MSYRIAIIEDEPATARNLQFLLQQIDPAVEILARLTGVAETAEWLKDHSDDCQLLFMDIRLNDGLCFEIFEKVKVRIPVVFVTAYNDYAIQAFKSNGIDYILKPFDETELRQALDKYNMLTAPAPASAASISAIAEALKIKTYKQSFLVHFREKLIPLNAADIAWFYTANETVYATTFDRKKYLIDSTLEELQISLDPSQYFRANRQFIVQRKAIQEIEFYFNGRLLIKTQPEPEDKILISKARTPEFKSWMNA